MKKQTIRKQFANFFGRARPDEARHAIAIVAIYAMLAAALALLLTSK